MVRVDKDVRDELIEDAARALNDPIGRLRRNARRICNSANSLYPPFVKHVDGLEGANGNAAEKDLAAALGRRPPLVDLELEALLDAIACKLRKRDGAQCVHGDVHVVIGDTKERELEALLGKRGEHQERFEKVADRPRLPAVVFDLAAYKRARLKGNRRPRIADLDDGPVRHALEQPQKRQLVRWGNGTPRVSRGLGRAEKGTYSEDRGSLPDSEWS